MSVPNKRMHIVKQYLIAAISLLLLCLGATQAHCQWNPRPHSFRPIRPRFRIDRPPITSPSRRTIPSVSLVSLMSVEAEMDREQIMRRLLSNGQWSLYPSGEGINRIARFNIMENLDPSRAIVFSSVQLQTWNSISEFNDEMRRQWWIQRAHIIRPDTLWRRFKSIVRPDSLPIRHRTLIR
jgi:hypothetical protein